MIYLGIFLLIGAGAVFNNWEKSHDFELWASRSEVERDALGSRYAHRDLIFRGGSRWTLKGENFKFQAEPQLRAITYSREDATPNQERVYSHSIQAPGRALRLDTDLTARPGSEFQVGFEQLSIEFKIENFGVTLGRQPFSLGVMKLVPLWNRFSTPLPLPGTLLQFPNRDGFKMLFEGSELTVQALAIADREQRYSNQLVEVVSSGEKTELRVLGGLIDDVGAVGFAGSTSAWSSSLRFEFLHFGVSDLDRSSPYSGNQLAIGFERALDEQWSLVAEGLHIDTGRSQADQYARTDLSVYTPFFARDYITASIRYDTLRFLTLSPQVVVNASDGSTLAALDIEYSLSDSAEIALRARQPLGDEGDEFSPQATPSGPLGTASEYSLRLKCYF